MKAEWVYERSCGRSLRLSHNPIGAAWSHPLLSTVGRIKEAIQERLIQTLTHSSKRRAELRMGHTMRNLTEMGLLKNRSVFICRPTPEEAMKWGESLDKLLIHKCKTYSLYVISFPHVYNELVILDVFDEFHWLGLNPQGWWLHCCSVLSMHVFSRLPALSHWMNGLLNMVNGSHSNPRWIESYIRMESEKDHRLKHSDKIPPSISWFLIKFTHFVTLKVLVMQLDPEIWGRRCLFPQRLFPSYENLRASTCCYQQALMRTERWLHALGRGHTSFYFNTGRL